MDRSGFADVVPPGAEVAIGIGSRGISNLAEIVRVVAGYWSSRGCKPFLFPAMGSHGAATAEGQREVLARYGITETAVGCPIASSLETVALGKTADGFETFAGADAWAGYAVMFVNRVKWHTSFAGAIESGLTKMMAIGLGKMDGARTSHTYSRQYGMEAVIRSVATHLIASGKVLGGLAILEDAHHCTAHIEAVPAAQLLQKEEALLRLAKSWKASLPVRNLDVLIVDEIGKNISGTGMDAKVINRGPAVEHSPDSQRIASIFVRDLSAASYGSAMGIGMADVMHSRINGKLDVHAGLVNAMTTGSLAQIRTPVQFGSDRECLEIAARTAGPLDLADTTIVWIRNTLELDTVAVSENLLTQAPGLERLGAPFEIPFDQRGKFSGRFYLEPSRITAPLPAISYTVLPPLIFAGLNGLPASSASCFPSAINCSRVSSFLTRVPSAIAIFPTESLGKTMTPSSTAILRRFPFASVSIIQQPIIWHTSVTEPCTCRVLPT